MPRIRTVRRRAKVIVATVVAASAAAGAAVVGSGWLDDRDDPTSAPVAVTLPTVTGNALIGQELSCALGAWERSPSAYTIAWRTATRATVGTGSPYMVAATDEGKKLRCEVTAANAVGSGKARSVLSATIAAPNPLLIVEDSFADTDTTLLQSHTGEVGATWTKHPSYTRDMTITLNRATSDGNSARSRYYASGVPSGADYDVEAVVYWDTTIVGDRVDIYGRLSTTVDEGYQVRWIQSAGGWQLTKINATVLTVLGSTYVDMPANGSSRTVKLKMRGSTLKVYIDGVLRITQTDSSITAAGRAGFGERLSTATTGVHVDSIIATLPSPTEPDCANGADDDSDTFVDLADPGCSDENDSDETDAPPPPDPLCDDGIDNDSPPDGLIDFGVGPTNDPGCADALDNDEYDEPPPPPPGELTANLWIDSNGGTCSRNTTASEYVDGAACATFQTSYSAAAYGDAVLVKAATYAAQTMFWVSGKTSEADEADVTFRPDGVVTVPSITSYGVRHATFDGFTGGLGAVTLECHDSTPSLASGARGQHSVDVSVTDSVLSVVRMNNAKLIRVSRNSIGPADIPSKVSGRADDGGADCTDEPPSDTVFEDNDFHDYRENVSPQHMECMFVEGTQGLIFRRNKFRACSVFDIFFQPQLGGAPFGMSNIDIDNNWFGHPVADENSPTAGTTPLTFSVTSSGTFTNVRIRHNSIHGGLRLDSLAITFVSTVVEGNVGIGRSTFSGACTEIAFTGNKWEDASGCPGDLPSGAAGWVRRETQAEWDSPTAVVDIDYHLTAGAACIGAATTTIADDYDGDVRPIDGTYDCGADEFTP